MLRFLTPETIRRAEAELRRREAAALTERCRSSFREFVRSAWPLAGTTEPLLWGWHLDAICDHLQAVEAGQIRRLLINEPPGHGKSKIVSVLFPAWVWTRSPAAQFLCATYAAAFAERDSGYARALVESDWYRGLFSEPGGWALKRDQQAKWFWANSREGHRLSIGVGGTGARADYEVIDDPISAVDVQSKAARDATNAWIGQTLTTRFNDASTGRAIMIMQRLHEEDPSSFVLSGGGWEHLCLPSEFEPARRSVTYTTRHVPANGVPAHDVRSEFWRDPRTEEGELLFPEKFPQRALDELKRANALGEVGFAGQHQQRPTPPSGAMFHVGDWRFWKPDGNAPDHAAQRPKGCYDGPAQPLPANWDRLIISVDATFRKTTSGSFVAIHVWGAAGARRCLLDRVHERMDFDETVRALLGVIRRWPEAREKVIEGKANGDAIISTLTNAHGVTGIVAENPGTESKEQRASAMLPYQRAGNVELPDGAPWLEAYIGEHALFPMGRWNDDVDCQSQALKALEGEQTTADNYLRVQW